MTSRAAYAVAAAPWGPIHVAATERGVAAVELLTPMQRFVESATARLRRPVEPARGARGAAASLASRAVDAIEAYLGGRTTAIDLPVDLVGRANWDQQVFAGLRGVGWGQVVSYGRLARRIGRPGAARAVGGAVGRNPVALLVPCHRVIAGDGTLGGYGGAWYGTQEEMLEIKRRLLELEGVTLPVSFAD